jgi:MerR family copper efflux transcriptional regulator
MTKLDEFVTIKEAAEFLGVSPNTLRNWHRDKKIPVYRSPISNYRLFKKKDLEKLLRQIEESGVYPTGWPRDAKRNRKPR